MTLKGTPQSRYSRVEPIQMPCSWRGSSPVLIAALVIRLRNLGLVRGRCIFLNWYAKNVGIEGWVVDEEVVVERSFGICGPKLFAP